MKRRRLIKKDLFVETQKKLTITYTWLIFLFLVVFSVIVSIFLMGIVYHDQQQNLKSALYAATDNGSLDIPNLTGSNAEDLYFYYVLDDKGNYIAGSEASPKNKSYNLGTVSEWHPKHDDFRLDWSSGLHGHRDTRLGKGREPILFIGARPIITNDGKTETIYAAKEVTFYVEVFERLLTVLLTILVVFLAAAVRLSFSMSKKAMVPIQNAYKQQQQFLADASHELRTPLSIMNTSFEVIELENGEALTPYSKEVLSDMKEEVGRMSRMVQHLLLLARSDAGSIQLELASFDLVPKVKQWVQGFEALAKTKEIAIRTQFPEELMVTGDAERLKQVVYILLDNAVKYTPENGTIDVILGANPKVWHLSVRDTGIGIPLEDQTRIFDRFYRSEKHRSREEGSAGLGLSIAKWIVEAHHGTIGVNSTVGAGSSFTITFPRE